MGQLRDSIEKGLVFLTDPRRRTLHGVIIAVVLAVHVVTHYATYIPAISPYLINLPYFRLHAIHEAEFLLIVAYAGVVYGLRGGLAALVVTAITSIPFIFQPYIIGYDPRPNEIRDQITQVIVVLLMGFFIVILYHVESRRRQAENQAIRLLEMDAVKSEFLSIASHELRTPMTSLYGYSELLLSRDAPQELQREWIRRIYSESGRLTKILDDLLNVSRLQTGRMAVRKEAVNLRPLIADAVENVKAASHNHAIEVQIEDGLPQVLADRDKITQVLINYLSNAIKYSPKGGRVTLWAYRNAGQRQVVLSIADEGIGIGPEDRAQLFTTFHRVRRPETQGIQGTGLGLYVVKSLVEQMGGSVWVESEVGKGSTFYFTLPEWTPQAAPAIDAEAASP